MTIKELAVLFYEQTARNRNITEITKMPASCMVNIDLPLSYDE